MRRRQQRLARAGEHGGELREVADLRRHVARQAHAHDEVEVGQLLGQRRHALDVGGRAPAALAGVGVGDVDAVRPRAEVALAVLQLETAELAAARVALAAGRAALPELEVARRALQSRVHQSGRDAGARAFDARARLRQLLAGAGVTHLDAGLLEQRERRLVDAPAGGVVPDDEAGGGHQQVRRRALRPPPAPCRRARRSRAAPSTTSSGSGSGW